ncbi:hypothetical protein MYX82_12995, partial [Acidobacteria bacterium AH-259-D05]|nr:hypothetical protein [Acidobacteria bacterium AH-259-D05]
STCSTMAPRVCSKLVMCLIPQLPLVFSPGEPLKDSSFRRSKCKMHAIAPTGPALTWPVWELAEKGASKD